jgi:imidazolonepropionase-like amidohydrolase
MRRLTALFLVLTFAMLGQAARAAAQNLVVTNARIIVRPGQTIEQGSIVVTNGRISSVGAGAPTGVPPGATTIDGRGMTVMAGFIDDHRHIIQGRGANVPAWLKEQAPARMMELLESGVTTVQSGGDDNAGVLELKRLINSGQMKGPRIIASGGVPTARMKDEAEVRAAVQQAVKNGADSIAEVHYPAVVWPYAPTEQETKNLAAGIDEARKLGESSRCTRSATCRSSTRSASARGSWCTR